MKRMQQWPSSLVSRRSEVEVLTEVMEELADAGYARGSLHVSSNGGITCGPHSFKAVGAAACCFL